MKHKSSIQITPIYIFELGLVLGPVLYVLFLSFMTRTETWAVEYRFTLQNYADILNPVYLPALKQSIKCASVTTFICIVLGYPAGLAMTRLDASWAKFFLRANMLPLFFNSMLRIVGLVIIFRKNGLLSMLLSPIGITGIDILYSFPAVVIGMVYVLLPMMIFSVYSSASRIDNNSREASRVMGASLLRSFIDIELPLTTGGLLNGVVLCFVPAMGLYIIASLLGGGKILLVSNVIDSQLMKVHNLPFASALAVILMLMTAAMVCLMKLLDPVAAGIRKAGRTETEKVKTEKFETGKTEALK